jgi:hypothetical protein
MSIHIKIYVGVNRPAKSKKKLKLHWDIGPVSEQSLPGPSPGEKGMTKLTNTQQAPIVIRAEDRRGEPAPIADITFSSSDESVVTVTQDANDPATALIKARKAGTAQIHFEGDADLGDGVNKLSGTEDIVVVAGQAVRLTASVGTPVEQPE